MLKDIKGLHPAIISDFIVKRPGISHNFHELSKYWKHFVMTVYQISETLSHLGPRTWGIVTIDIKNATSLNSVGESFWKKKPSNCPCKLCKTYTGKVLSKISICHFIWFYLHFKKSFIRLFYDFKLFLTVICRHKIVFCHVYNTILLYYCKVIKVKKNP